MTDDFPIDATMQQVNDYCWYAVDSEGNIGGFTTGGFAKMATGALRSEKRLRELNDLLEFDNTTILDRTPIFVPQTTRPGLLPANDKVTYADYLGRASKGIFAFDCADFSRFGGGYVLIAKPRKRLNVAFLPFRVQELLMANGRIMGDFAEISEVLEWQFD